MSKYLFISPHVDDSELMCGGTIAKLVESGHNVNIVTLSVQYEGKSLIHEWEDSLETLDITGYFHNYETRMFYKDSNNILQSLFDYSGYDYVFAPSIDFHSDHSVVARAAVRAFKHSNLLSWCPDWNERKFIKNYFVKLEDRHVQKKLDALKCYKSQQDKPYFKEEYLLGSLHVNGLMANCKYAEAFQVVNLHA